MTLNSLNRMLPTLTGSCWGARARRIVITALLSLLALTAHAQVTYPLNANGSMGLGSPNGDFAVAQDDLKVKVPGGYVRINRDFDGHQWVFNRQWSGLGSPSFYRASYASIGSYFSCLVIDGVSSCDNTATAAGTASLQMVDTDIQQTRVPSDPNFGRDAQGNPLPDLSTVSAVARKGVGFTRSTDGTAYVSSKYPRFIVRPQAIQLLPASTGANAHPSAGKPGQGGVATTQVTGFRWTDRSGEWIEYDNLGRISSYGDRNDVRVWFQHGSHGQIERVLDDNGRTVVTVLYTPDGNFITEARDHTPANGVLRRVSYQYDGRRRLNVVVDARGNATTFDYGSTGGLGAVSSVYKIVKVTDAEKRPLGISYGMTGRIDKFTAADGGVTDIEYGYDKLKKEFSTTVKSPQTANGRKIETLHYDQEGRLVFREVNAKTLLTAEGSGRNLTYKDEQNNSTSIQRDHFDEVTRITYADGTTMAYTYEAGSTQLREVTDPAGAVTRFTYDARGNLIKREAALGRPEQQVTEYQVNARGEAEVVRRKGGLNPDGTTDVDTEIRLVRDSTGNVKELRDGEDKLWKYEYDGQGNVTKVVDPLHHEWTYTYDNHGNPLTETDPNQVVVRYDYDKTDKATAVTDGRNKTTRFGHDAVGRETTLINPYNETFTDRYDVAGQLTSRIDAGGLSSAIAYDSAGRLAKVIDGENFQTLLDYADYDGVDRGGNHPGKIAYPTYERRFRYDSRKRPTQQTTLLAGDALVTGATYDIRGRLKTQTDPNGHTRSFEYDAFGRLTASIDELGATVKLGYDHRGNLISVVDAKNKTTRMVYDRRSLLVSETNPLGETTRYVYDDAGNRIELLRPNGVKVVYDYDPAGRLETRKAYRADASLEQTDSYQWDAADNLKVWTTDRARGVLQYDDADRLLSEAVTIDGVTLTRAYTYYGNDQVKTYTGPDGVVLTYTYTKNGEVARVDIPGEGSISATEWNWMAPKKVTLPGGTVQEIERDGLFNLTRLKVKSPSQATLFELENRFGKLRELESRNSDGRATAFEYDEAVRLTKADAGFMAGTSETFVIDKAGNRESHSAVSGTWEYDDANRLKRRGNVSYDYDGAGNLIRKVDAGQSEPLRTTGYTYDGHNRLIEVRDGANAIIATYAYDPYDYRLIKEVFAAGAARGGSAGKTLYLHGEEGLLAETSATGTVLRSYGWHPERTYATYPLFQRADSQYFYYHNDHLGTPWRVTNRAGEVVWAASDYTAFGTAKVAAGAQLEQSWRFPGQYLDAETGLHYNLRRYYDAETGRYVSEDPLGFESDSNFYAYARHSPTNLTDPTGEILPLLIPLAINYARCVAGCVLMDIALQGLTDPCNIENPLKDCAVSCLLGGLPMVLKKPCKLMKLAGALGGAAGAAAAASSFNSFPGDTEIATPDGLKRIEDIRPGDKVLSYAEWKGETQVEEVTDLVLSNHEQTIVTLTLSTGEELEVTGGHPLHTPTGWRAAQLLLAGGQLDIKGPDGKLVTVTIENVEQRQEVVAVYNIEVSNAHSFYVGKEGVLAHNGDGAYYLEFDDGTHYVGKGNEVRMRESIRQKTKGNKRKCIFSGHAKISGTDASYIAEDMIMEAAGEARGPGSLNIRNSPGKRLRRR